MVDDLGAPMDVLWMRMSRRPDDPGQTLGRVDTGRILVMLNREDYWQCAFVIAKGGFDDIRRRGLAGLPRGDCPPRPLFGPADRRAARLVRHQTADRRGRSSAGVAPARPPVHRRRRSRDVADRRRRHQPGDPGRGGRSQHPGPAHSPGRSLRRRSARGAAPPRVSDAGDAAVAGDCAKSGHRPRAQEYRKTVAAACFCGFSANGRFCGGCRRA